MATVAGTDNQGLDRPANWIQRRKLRRQRSIKEAPVMMWGKWDEALITALLAVGLANGQQPGGSPSKGTEDSSILTLQEPGKPDQKVKILKTYRTADGKTAYEVQDVATGQHATLFDSGTGPALAPAKPTSSAGSRLRDLPSRIFRLGRKSDAPVTKPAQPVETKVSTSAEPPSITPGVGSATPLETPTKQTKAPVKGQLVSASESDRKPESKPAPGEAAPPTDWHQSWGKADYHLAPGSAKVTDLADKGPTTTSVPSTTKTPLVVDETAHVPAAEVNRLTAILRSATYPSERERAVNSLTTADWHAHPTIVPALIQAARDDPAATVRAACVHSLAKLKASTEPVIATLRTLQRDPDARVRQEVDAALVALSTKSD
jgi:hypothetical protein